MSYVLGGERRLGVLLGESRRKEITQRSRRRCEGGIVLTLKKQVGRACNGFIWLRVVKRGGLV